ncbi:MAG: hypothetical protein HOB98_23020 [Gammaproteobacteria bacterium]|nr:hypothetical protein [Gammaproteobacteria bacterium]MBT3866292.1 hypothetical protein [Gammaproteobacteria bacterium]MBT4380110.1 hypothetical protein [Gammaproteobacteria bacterium]MBT4619308.1 hypothetical protein [Gammaproteobacteria bacterium]MBT5198530.1 hypothetical protein [Gammaproteobacteria bacterium]
MWEVLDVGGTGSRQITSFECLAPIMCAMRTMMLVRIARIESMRRTVTTPAC